MVLENSDILALIAPSAAAADILDVNLVARVFQFGCLSSEMAQHRRLGRQFMTTSHIGSPRDLI